MEDKQEEAILPPCYKNLGFDGNLEVGPSAPKLDEALGSQEASAESTPGPSCPPPQHEEEIGPKADHGKVPSAPIAEEDTDPTILQYTSPTLLFEDIYEACIQYVRSHCFYSSRFARQMKLTEIKNDCAFHYSLESYGEKRESETKYVPYKGGPVDGGLAPEPWDISIPIPTPFKDGKTQQTIPHSEKVVTCIKCNGGGKVSCSVCSGTGENFCWSCGGSGRDKDSRQTCSFCHGSGTQSCLWCGGSGKVKCSKCEGYGKLKSYRVLTVTWKNHPSEFVSDIKQLPSKKFTDALGDTLFFDDGVKLSPITNAPEASVNTASACLLEAHQNSFPTEKFRLQRHSLCAIPFTIAKYKWKEEEGEFYIYGKENKVYFENYPTDCCCICC